MSAEDKLETILAAMDHRRQALIHWERVTLSGIIRNLIVSYLEGSR